MPVIARCDVCRAEKRLSVDRQGAGNRAARLPNRWIVYGGGMEVGCGAGITVCSEACAADYRKRGGRVYQESSPARASDRSLPAPAGFPAALRARRVALGLSQDGLARRVGIPQNAVSFYELGKKRPHRGRLEQLARALGVPPEELLA